MTVAINVARTNDEAERQAKGEDVIQSAADEDRALAEAQAAALFEEGAEPEELASEGSEDEADGEGGDAQDEEQA